MWIFKAILSKKIHLGFDYKIKTLINEDYEYKLHIWDTAGQEKFRSLTLNFYKGVSGIILVFDLTDEESFSNIPHWIRQLKIYASENISMILLGNKCDLLERKVNSERITEICEDYKLKYFETSAKLNFNVDDAFLHIAKDIREKKKMEKSQDERDQKKKGKGVKLKNTKDESISDVSNCNC